MRLTDIINESVIMEPRGWKHFNKDQMKQEKIKVLKKFDLSTQEILDFIFLN